MTLSLKRIMIEELDQVLGPRGFIRVSDKFHGHRYDRPFSCGRKSIGINWHFRRPVLVLDPPNVSVTLNEVEELVARYEEKNAFMTPADVAWRSTIGLRLDRGEILNKLIGKWTAAAEDDCRGIVANFVAATLRKAESFWSTVATPDAILAKLSDDPVKVRDYAMPDHVGAERAIVLSKLLHGSEKSRALARDRLARLSGSSKIQLVEWLSRFPFDVSQGQSHDLDGS
jgi:hypothetical protein